MSLSLITTRTSQPYIVIRLVILLLFTLALFACATNSSRHAHIKEKDSDGPPKRDIDINAIKDASPKHEPFSKYGNPPSYEVNGKRYYTLKSNNGYIKRGIASWYGSKFHGRRTSSGETYDMYAMTAAHKTLPLPTYARVTNLNTGKSVVLKINDRGPFHENRLIDLSFSAASKLGIVAQGTGLVEVKVIDTFSLKDINNTTSSATPVYLQVGAFNKKLNAEHLRKRLQHLEAAVQVNAKKSGETAIYHVRIGPLNNTHETEQLVSTVTNMGLKPFIVFE